MGAETPDVKSKLIRSGHDCSQYYKSLLEQVNMVSNSVSIDWKGDTHEL